jgi:hypothetical protein
MISAPTSNVPESRGPFFHFRDHPRRQNGISIFSTSPPKVAGWLRFWTRPSWIPAITSGLPKIRRLNRIGKRNNANLKVRLSLQNPQNPW